MITQFKDYTQQTPQSQETFDPVQYERRMMVFENYWNDSVFNGFNNQSVKPFLENIGLMIGEQVTVGHRYITSKESLSYYLKTPGGVIWDHPETFPITYFGFHGNHNGFQLPQEGLISKDDILEMCTGFKDFPTVLYFGSCSLFEDDDQFGYDVLESSGSCGVLGFKEKIPFNIGMLIDLLFISSFFLFPDGNPFDNLEYLYSEVIKEFPVSKELGFTLYI